MNRGIRRVGTAVTILILVLVAQLTYLQIVDAKNLADDPLNVRGQLRDVSRPRGEIVTADGEVVAKSVPSTDNTDFKYQRQYPLGPLIEPDRRLPVVRRRQHRRREDVLDELVGRSPDLQLQNLQDIFSGNNDTGRVVLSVNAALQRLAATGARAAARVGGPARRQDGRHRRDVLEPVVRRAAAGGPRHQGRQRVLPAAQREPRQAEPAARLARALPARFDVQDGHRVGRARRRRRLRQDLPVPQRAPAAADDHDAQELRRRDVRRDARQSFVVSCNTTFGQIGLDLGNRSCPAWPGSAWATSPRSTSRRVRWRASAPSPVPSRTTCRRSRRLRSVRATSRSRRCRWRSSPRRSRTAGSSTSRTSSPRSATPTTRPSAPSTRSSGGPR